MSKPIHKTESPPEPLNRATTFRCPRCGSREVEVLAWVSLNGEPDPDDAEPPDHWCPDCEEHFDTVCEVDAEGQCRMHDKPVTVCRAEFARPGGP